jgi:alpha-beta hydrolase superfamily lysophospholipase
LKHKVEEIDEMGVAWALPPQGQKGLKGIVVLLHGCSRTHEEWFTLPEGRRLVKLLHHRGYATLAPKSRRSCWDDVPKGNWDLDHTTGVLRAMQQRWEAGHKPVFAFGASSGG